MNRVDKQLFENIFDSLDRLFDDECGAIDVYVLLFASNKALSEPSILSLECYIIELDKLVSSDKPHNIQREEAIAVTNGLRIKLNELLPM